MSLPITSNEFESRYQELNKEQKEAVDAIYGPVMVIAGPGTGKTEVLAMRIANLLLSDAQVKANEILCLTYTDEGTVAMRKRLLEIIGPDAHRVNIFTFHAFCSHIIQSNPQYFGMRDLKPLDELERTEILHGILENLPQDHLLRRLKGDIFYDAKNLYRLFELMKSENWSPETVCQAIDDYLDDLPQRPAFRYKVSISKRNIKAGDPKINDIAKQKQVMERTRSAVLLYDEYQKRVNDLGRYDFSDMILWVIKAFRENEALLQTYQERFPFVLVDEFQDTSLSQSGLLNLLTSYDDSPNLFVVGDDDQSIFAFQGARVKNVEDFYERYKNNIRVIVLKKNYRSSQPIIDASLSLINHNQLRLIKSPGLAHLNLDKNIVAAGERFKTEDNHPKPVIRSYYNAFNEEADILRQIESLRDQGVPLNRVVILYSKHRQAANLISLMERKGLPYWVKRPYNILQLPVIIQLLQVFRYIQIEQSKPLSAESQLFELMHAPFFNIVPLDIARLSLYMQSRDSKHKHWRFLLQDTLLLETMDLKNPGALHKAGALLEKWITEARDFTVPMLLEKILYEGGVVSRALNTESRIWDMQVLYTFSEFTRELSARQKNMGILQFLNTIDRMMIAGISVPIQKVVHQEDGVRFFTAYSVKGHEFEYVFLIGCNKEFWEKRTGENNGFQLPDTLTRTSADEDSGSPEVMRRVFFVALTRAKKHLQVSFSARDNMDKKDLESSVFIDELTEAIPDFSIKDLAPLFLPGQELANDIGISLLPAPAVSIRLAEEELLRRRLEHFSLSVSALNKYLKCPVGFYYEYILQVPVAKNDSLAFGTAIHYALEQFFRKMQNDPEKNFPSLKEAVSWFRFKMDQYEDAFTQLQFGRRLELGEQVLSDYIGHYLSSFNKVVAIERMISNVEVRGVPLKGKIDKIEFDGTSCIVVDYKTGNPAYSKKNQLNPPSDGNELGGDYWRQMVFYKILLDNYPEARQKGWQMQGGLFDYLEKYENKGYIRHYVQVSPEDVTTVAQQILAAWENIQQGNFHTGCGKDDCHWCRFVKTNQLDMAAGPEEEEDHASL